MDASETTAEARRLAEDARREKNWKRWGPYLAERQWGTVREDYSADGDSWNYFPHDHARSRAYRWGEDGLLGITDRECRLCFALALWNGKDAILKERLFGLTNPEGNHGEDVKECYFYLDATPTYSYLKGLYKYPQAEFPYARLVAENRAARTDRPEFELADTGIFDGNRYFDVLVEYAKASPNDLLIRITVANRGPEPAVLHLLPTLWFRNTWIWGCGHEGCWAKPWLRQGGAGGDRLPARHLGAVPPPGGHGPRRLRGPTAVHRKRDERRTALRHGQARVPSSRTPFTSTSSTAARKPFRPEPRGTKAAAHYRAERLPPAPRSRFRLRLSAEEEVAAAAFRARFRPPLCPADRRGRRVLSRTHPAGRAGRRPPHQPPGLRRVALVEAVLSLRGQGLARRRSEPAAPAGGPQAGPQSRLAASVQPRRDFHARQVGISLVCRLGPGVPHDPLGPARSEIAKEQLVLFLREWYMHPSGQMPAYEFGFDDVNPPVHAWACWRVYKMTGPRGQRDRLFLARAFHKLLINFTWWVNRKDVTGKHLFAGGFLGLDNIGVFDRSKPLPGGGGPGAGRRHGVDGLLLRHHAVHGAGTGRPTTRPTRTSPRSSSSISWPSPTP